MNRVWVRPDLTVLATGTAPAAGSINNFSEGQQLAYCWDTTGATSFQGTWIYFPNGGPKPASCDVSTVYNTSYYGNGVMTS